MELKALKQNIKRRKGVNPDDYLKMFNYQQGACAMCLDKHEEYDLVADPLRIVWELRLVCPECSHVLTAISRNQDHMLEYIRESMVH